MNLSRGALDSATAETAARAIGESLRQAAALATNADGMAREGERLRRMVMQSRPTAVRGSQRTRWVAVAVLAAGAALAIGLSATFRASAPLQVKAWVGDSSASVGAQYLAAPEGQPLELRFSDGSQVKVLPFARVRIEELLASGATILVEKGLVDVQVRHRENSTRWRVLAGPFAIDVTGTQFNVAWNPESERIVVELREGRVEINGPKFAAPATLKSGQRFDAAAGEARWVVSPMAAGASKLVAGGGNAQVPVSEVEQGEAAVAEALPAGQPRRAATSMAAVVATDRNSKKNESIAESSGATRTSPSDVGRQWPKLVASGEWKQVTREADALGLMVCLANCSGPDLRALADASRYTGRLDTAEAALRVLYDKHPAQANTAAYLLGVVDETRGRNTSALRWYEEYLSRGSSGTFAPEARTSRLRMLVATGGSGAARQAARDYLDKEPNGSGASLATKVLEGR